MLSHGQFAFVRGRSPLGGAAAASRLVRENVMIVTRAAVAVSAFALVAACSRTPPEPAPSTSTSSPASSATALGAAVNASSSGGPAAAPKPAVANGRCVTPMSDSPASIPASASPPACPKDPEPNTKLPEAKVAFPDAPNTPHVDVELVKSEHDIQKGLMYRQSMPEERGMLFKLDERRDHTFWMHNTCIPLDMMFVDDDGLIVGIVEAAKPLDDATRSVGCPSSYVLEVNAGWSRRHGVKPGQKLGLPPSAR